MSASDTGTERRPDSLHPSAPEDTYASWVGRVIDARYRIDGLLGEGGMGAVFEAEHLKLLKPVALKVIHPEFAGDGEVAKRFVREAMASAQLEHPHVASATDYGTLEEGGAYLVMPLVRGSSLRETIDEVGALAWTRACVIGAQIADALSSAHKAGIVHRDLKPDNVMLEPRDDGGERVLVLDFGIARVADEKLAATREALTRVGTVIGTPGYMAPEQALGEAIDFRVDLYAMGLLLFEMVRGEALFAGDDLTAIVTRQLTEPPPRLAGEGRVVPDALGALVHELLQKEREARPATAAEVRERLNELVLGAQLQRVASGERSLPVGPVTGPFPHERTSAEPTGPARRRTAVAATMMAKPAPTPALAEAGPAAEQASPAHPGGAAEQTGGAAEQTGGAQAGGAQAGSAQAAAPRLASGAAPDPAVVVGELLGKAKALPVPLLAAAGAAVAVFGLASMVGVAALVSDDDAPAGLVKQEMAGPPPAPEEPEEAPEEPEEEEAPAGRIPPALQQAYADVMLGDRRNVRRRAARDILAHEPSDEVPELLRAVAEIERTGRCRVRRDAVVRLGELGDIRALPVLERLENTPRNQCGNIFRRVDCLGCLRDELDEALARLRPE